MVVVRSLVALALLTSCTLGGPAETAERAQEDHSADSAHFAAEAAPSNARIGTCPLDQMSTEVMAHGRASGRTITVVGFTNVGDEPCDLVDPLGVKVPSSENEVVRRSFFPVEPFSGPLEPGATAAVGIESGPCADIAGRVPEGVVIFFPEDVRVGVSLDLPATCGLSWEGFRVWE